MKVQRMDSLRKIKKSKKSIDTSEYYKLKDQQAKHKITYFVIRGITFRSIIIFFILFNLIFSYFYKFKAGWILMTIILFMNVCYLAVEVLIIKKKIPKTRKFIQRMKLNYIDMGLMVLVFTLFLILFFSITNEPRHWYDGFPKECETYANSCARLGYSNQYRTNKIPSLTFRNVSEFDVKIDEYMRQKYDGWIVKYEVKSGLGYDYLQYSISNSLGILNDVAIKIDSCQDVWSTTSLAIQSQLRLGLKDYGSNYEITEDLIKFLQGDVDINKQNYIYCKAKND
jgi:hypothetical protein